MKADILIVDAFDDDHVPIPLRTEEFLRTARDRLEDGGVIAYNVIGAISGDRSKAFRSLYRMLRNAWREVWVFNVDESVETDHGRVEDRNRRARGLRDRALDRKAGLRFAQGAEFQRVGGDRGSGGDAGHQR